MMPLTNRDPGDEQPECPPGHDPDAWARGYGVPIEPPAPTPEEDALARAEAEEIRAEYGYSWGDIAEGRHLERYKPW